MFRKNKYICKIFSIHLLINYWLKLVILHQVELMYEINRTVRIKKNMDERKRFP